MIVGTFGRVRKARNSDRTSIDSRLCQMHGSRGGGGEAQYQRNVGLHKLLYGINTRFPIDAPERERVVMSYISEHIYKRVYVYIYVECSIV